jgi:hypothetical protein
LRVKTDDDDDDDDDDDEVIIAARDSRSPVCLINIQCWRTTDTPDLLRLSKNGIEARG